MATNEVKFRIKLETDGQQKLHELTVNADDFRAAVDEATREVRDLDGQLINMNQRVQAFEQVAGVVRDLESVLGGLASAYAAQETAEAGLATAMRNTMGATADDVEAIKRLTAAQQELGVVGDEVQLAGAQKLATYLKEREALEALIPVMNDMAVAEAGVDAGASDVAAAANVLGRAMQGNTTMLERQGYVLTEAQKELLTYGTEAQRAAVLAEVVGARVGGMNAELAKTDSGRLKQVTNELGDQKEKWGKLAAAVMPYISRTAQVTTALTGLGKTVNVVRGAVTALGLSMRAALITSGVGAAVVALTVLIEKLGRAEEETARKSEALASAEEVAARRYGEVKTTIDKGIETLEELTRAKRDTTVAVNELASALPGLVSAEMSGAEALDVMREKSREYCTQLALQAKMQELVRQQAENDAKMALNQQKQDDLTASGDATRSVQYANQFGVSPKITVDTPEMAAAKEEMAGLKKDAQTLAEEIERVERAMQNVGGAEGVESERKSYNELGKEIEDVRKRLGDWKGTDDGAKELREELAVLEAQRAELGRRLGLVKETAAVAQGLKPMEAYDLDNIEGATALIADLRTAQRTAEGEALDGVNAAIAMAERRLAELQGKPQPPITQPIRLVHTQGGGESATDSKGQTMEVALAVDDSAAREELARTSERLAGQIPPLELTVGKPNLSGLKAYHKAVDEARESNAELIEGLQGAGKAMSALGEAIGGTAGEWLEWGASVVDAIATAIPQIAALTAAHRSEGAAAATSSMEQGANAVAGIPFVGPALAVAAIASIGAALLAMPKFADGGLAYGPTLGLFGEYAGAASNPEVVAPLSKLKDIIEPGQAAVEIAVAVQYRMRGRDLLGTVRKEQRVEARGGRR